MQFKGISPNYIITKPSGRKKSMSVVATKTPTGLHNGTGRRLWSRARRLQPTLWMMVMGRLWQRCNSCTQGGVSSLFTRQQRRQAPWRKVSELVEDDGSVSSLQSDFPTLFGEYGKVDYYETTKEGLCFKPTLEAVSSKVFGWLPFVPPFPALPALGARWLSHPQRRPRSTRKHKLQWIHSWPWDALRCSKRWRSPSMGGIIVGLLSSRGSVSSHFMHSCGMANACKCKSIQSLWCTDFRNGSRLRPHKSHSLWCVMHSWQRLQRSDDPWGMFPRRCSSARDGAGLPRRVGRDGTQVLDLRNQGIRQEELTVEERIPF